MHYLAQKHIRDIADLGASPKPSPFSQIQTSTTNSRAFLMYEDSNGVLHLSENDNLRRLQVQRMVFKMQISKTLLNPADDSIVVLLEQPNMDYLDTSKKSCNVVGLVSRSTMRTQAIYSLQKKEIANCATLLETSELPKGLVNIKRHGQGVQIKRKWLLVGTAFLYPEETIPSSGRLLMFDAKTMELAQELRVEGSVQAIVVTDHNNFLLLGVNNKIQAYDMPAFLPQAHGPGGSLTKPGKLDLLCSKESGTFIHSIVKLVTLGT